MRICKAPVCENPAIKNRTLCTKHKHRFRKTKDFNIPERVKKEELFSNGIIKICKVHGNLKYHQCYIQYSKYKDKKYKYYQCKECVSIKKMRLYYLDPQKHINFSKKTAQKYKEKFQKRKNEYHIKTMIDLDKYYEIIIKQDNKCAICKKSETAKHKNGKIKRLSIDHHHLTGKFRGLLCGKCNTGLGLFKESIEILQLAIEYLKSNK